MITVKRTAYIEQDNGDLVCSITIPAEHRARLLSLENAEPIAVTLPLAPVRLHVKTMLERITDLGPHAKPSERVQFITDLQDVETRDFGVDAAPAAPAQTLGVNGMDTAEVMSTASLEGWKHPAAAHLRGIFMHEPFQRFAFEHTMTTDAFAAPMVVATNLIRDTVKSANGDKDLALQRLAMLMDDYNRWCARTNTAPWPG